MSLTNDIFEDRIRMMTKSEKFSKLFHELERCREDEQKQKIKEMNEMINEMDFEEFKSVFTVELFNKIHQMIEEKTFSLENALMLLKHAGYYKELKYFSYYYFDYSLLSERMKEMMIDENEKKKERNEKILTDICECYLYLKDGTISRLPYACVTCLLKVALKKDETEEAQKEVEMALLALSCIRAESEIEQKLYLNEIKEIIKYHQEHQNLTRLTYQSAWGFLINRFYNDESLENLIMNELHFGREARRELEELSMCIDWKRKEERGKEAKEAIVIERWIYAIDNYLTWCALWSEEFVSLLRSIVQAIERKGGG
eukprot:MONOS_4228.1-p1 / transcript=MONOS_4228.1 / gene=MONOS_4228 / organism=Monocercomonoides_exilis_PA203 / gene_product=unspecified product / transcript_product=unspecified product / location=Mono_scaffold00110:17323-18600(-) / protein_length=315 / sequence_SO=supercontig / SO=protein_coding / is_pseudo=false